MNLFGPIKQVRLVKEDQQVITGESFDRLIASQKNLNRDEKKRLEKSSIEIIKNCVSPSYPTPQRNSNTGLVIGKIQSGKTLSFTSVMALARDNGYKVVIVISGRTNLLLKQTIDRLKNDLANEDRYMSIITNAETENKKEDTVRQLKRILSRNLPGRTKTLMIPILKHQGRLAGLRNVFQNIQVRGFLETNSVLVIDDEADQASLNTQARNNERFGLENESAIFASIKSLRHALPNHTYIQYTATPQAPLLIDTAMILSPDWHVLLTPGHSYTGGEIFFEQHRNIVDIIPQEGNYPPAVNELQAAPESLKQAIVEFLILSAIMGGWIDKLHSYNDRATMLVHPTWRVIGKDENVAIETFFDWIHNIVEGYENDLEVGDYASFLPIYDEVRSRLEPKGLFEVYPESEKVFEAILDWVLIDLKVHQVTGGKLEAGEEFPWGNHAYHILVGGQLLDRGFTVENLIMTYMPRDTVGNNQADTIEQRCRFYGYRKKYIDFCRVYITRGLREDYLSYNDHEKELYNYLKDHTLAEFMEEGSKILMDKNLIPTNLSRISNRIIKAHLRGFQFFNPQYPFIDKNNLLIENFIGRIHRFGSEDLEPLTEEHRRPNVRHRVTKVPIEMTIDLMLDFEFNNKHEIMRKQTILRYVEHIKERFPNCWVIEIAYTRPQPRERTVHFEENPKNARNQYEMNALAAGDTEFKDGNTYFSDSSLLIETDFDESSSKKFGYDGGLILQLHKIKAARNTDKSLPIRDQVFYTPAFRFSKELEARYISTLQEI